ncbi:MAG: hypothetical protein WCL10_19985, partial [Novosphingobium sp.]|uniref:hypothetical protein n=1 Tax=Novosphingobium sp. TaxID=1874826 RepID=UPI003019BDDC
FNRWTLVMTEGLPGGRSSSLALSAANDLSAEISDLDDEQFDYKKELKSAKWCKAMAARILAQYKKDVGRKKADPVANILGKTLIKAG